MEFKNNFVEETAVPLFPLNFDCMYDIFRWLGIEDCMNLAEAYDGMQGVADWIFKTKFNQVAVYYDESTDIDRIIYHIGPFVQSLSLTLTNKFHQYTEQFYKIQETCENLKNLNVSCFDRSDFKTNPFCGASVNLEMLMLTCCSLGNDKDFFNRFTNLKSLCMHNCKKISDIALKRCFQNNPTIVKFDCVDKKFLYKELQLLTNLNQLRINYDHRRMNLSFLSELQSLRKLYVYCQNKRVIVDSLLIQLASKSDLEELELDNAFVDGNTFATMKSFRNLQRLIVTRHHNLPSYNFMSSNELPLKLNFFKLGNFHISEHQILSLIEQRKFLENISIDCCNWLCHTDCTLRSGRDFNSIANSIIRNCNSNKNRRVNLILCQRMETLSNDFWSEVNYLTINVYI